MRMKLKEINQKNLSFFSQNLDIFTISNDDDNEILLNYNESDIDNLELQNDEENKETKVKTWINHRKDVVQKYFNISTSLETSLNFLDQSNIINLADSIHTFDLDTWRKQLLDFKKSGYPKETIPSKTNPDLLEINNDEPIIKIPKIDTLTHEELAKEVINKYNLDESQQLSFNLFTSLLFNNKSDQMMF